eukprot:1161098-Prymnesium_polylepis.2
MRAVASNHRFGGRPVLEHRPWRLQLAEEGRHGRERAHPVPRCVCVCVRACACSARPRPRMLGVCVPSFGLALRRSCTLCVLSLHFIATIGATCHAGGQNCRTNQAVVRAWGPRRYSPVNGVARRARGATDVVQP